MVGHPRGAEEFGESKYVPAGARLGSMQPGSEVGKLFLCLLENGGLVWVVEPEAETLKPVTNPVPSSCPPCLLTSLGT